MNTSNILCFVLYVPVRMLQTSEDGLDKLIKAGSPTQPKSPGITEVLEHIQEVVTGHLYAVSKAMVDLDHAHSGTISKDGFRQLWCHFLMTLPSDQVNKKTKTPPSQ